jgi:PTH2 family peptidyl-tRNA hydrolase
MRTDLRNTEGHKVRTGKLIAQGCHASMKVFFDRMFHTRVTGTTLDLTGLDYEITMTPEMKEWKDGKFTKICVSVDSEEELMNVYNKAKEVGLPCALIEDAGLTEFNGVVTKTCCAIGPANAEDIDKITGGLKLL